MLAGKMDNNNWQVCDRSISGVIKGVLHYGAIIDAGNDCVSTCRLHRVSVDWLDRLLSGIVRFSTIDAEIVAKIQGRRQVG